MSKYKKRTKADETFKEGGYKGVVYFAPTSSVTTWGRPTSTPTVLGDKVKITTAHTFAAGEGVISLVCKKHSVTTTAETTGEPGAKSLTHKAKFIILGDGASTLEGMQEQLNDDLVYWVKDQDCLQTNELIQFGDECLPVDVTVTFDGKTTAEGLKEYTVELSVKSKKFFYSGALLEQPVTTSGAPVITNQPNDWTTQVSGTIALSVAVSGTGPFTYAWFKNGVVVPGQVFSQFEINGAQLSDAGSYTVTITNPSGSVTSAPATVTIV